MKKDIWDAMSDEQKTVFMHNVFKDMDVGAEFDYSECKKWAERFKEAKGEYYGVFNNPCVVLELTDPILACRLMSWLYRKYDENGNPTSEGGQTAPLFGYTMKELYFNKGSLMQFSDSEKDILRRAIEILKEKTNEST